MSEQFGDFYNKLTKEIQQQHLSYLEMMAASFLKQTNIPPDEAELVEWLDSNGVYHFHFQRRLETIGTLKAKPA